MRTVGSERFRWPTILSAPLAVCLILNSSPALPQAGPADEVVAAGELYSASIDDDPAAPIVVGTRAAVGTDTAAEKAAEGVVGGVLGGLLGGGDSRRADDRPDTVRDPTRKLDYVEISAMDGSLETAARSQWTDGGLLVSLRIEDAPAKGTFQAVFLQTCDGRRFYPVRYEIYKLWNERSVSVGWSRTTTHDGSVTESSSGRVGGQWGDGVAYDALRGDPSIWSELGFDKAHHGARQIGAYFDIDPAEFTRLDTAGLFLHTTLPSREPVTTAVSMWLIGPDKRGDPGLQALEAHPDGWWGHCGGRPTVLAATMAPAAPGGGEEDFWASFELAGVAAKVLGKSR